MTTGAKMFGPTKIDVTTQFPENGTAIFASVLSSARQIYSDSNTVYLPLWCKESLQFFTWDLKTGQFLYKTDPLQTNGFALYNWESKIVTPDGYMYNWGYDGFVHAYDVTNGDYLWNFSTGDAGLNTPYGVWPTYNGITIMDGKLFTQTSDHGNGVEPLYQGEGLYALDYKTGQHLWNITGWWEQPVIADGIYVTHNCYDNQIYAIGKGPSEVTVTANPAVQAKGGKVLIQGTVADISAGAKVKVATGEFNIVPMVSDEFQGQWMNYIYQQQEMPTHASGVTVYLTAIDSNHNTIDIGTTTSDLSGFYKFVWTPPNEGEYTVTAAFEGSNSYWQSSAKTGVVVSSSPSASVSPGGPTPIVTPSIAPSPEAQAQTTLYIAIAAVVIIVAVVAAAVLLRRRK
jgi:outer membrane protein assembly factor BamB